jgi:hypothetical protein
LLLPQIRQADFWLILGSGGISPKSMRYDGKPMLVPAFHNLQEGIFMLAQDLPKAFFQRYFGWFRD